MSSRIAAAIAKDVGELERIEHVKGILFVLVTGVLLWGVSFALFRRLEWVHETRALERRTMMVMQSKAYAAELAAAVAHDFNNLLMVLRAGVDEIHENALQTIDPTTLDTMDKAIDSARNLTDRMARAARGERSNRKGLHSLSELVDDTVHLLRRLPRLRGRNIEVVSTSAGRVFLDPVLVEQILVNLLLNAADAVGKEGHIRVEVNEETDAVCLSVHDNGTGLSDAMLNGIFEPFKSTKETGLGLGLLSVRASVEASEGRLCVTRSPLGGAQFEVRWNKAA